MHVVTWVLLTVPLLGASLAYVGFQAPSWAASVSTHAGALAGAVGDGHLPAAALQGLALLGLAVPLMGLAIVGFRAARRCARARG